MSFAAQPSSIRPKLLYSVGVGLGVSILSGLSYMYYKYIRKEIVPEKWKRIGTLEQIYFYPVKSCAPIDLNDESSVNCEVLGIRKGDVKDRSLMLIDENGTMVSARTYPKMVKITPKVVGRSKIMLSAPGMENDLVLDLIAIGEEASQDVRTDVWGTKIDAMLCGERYDAWFSQFIIGKSEGLRLVYYPYPIPTRQVQIRMRNGIAQNKDTGAFPDATSYMLINLSSVDDLNTRLQRQVSPLQFRGNFYLKMDDSDPFAEDNWKWLKIGNDVIFKVIAPCSRCIFTNINPYSAERDPDGNPLKTLKTYRKWENHDGPIMGIHLGIRTAGLMKANDIIYVEDTSK